MKTLEDDRAKFGVELGDYVTVFNAFNGPHRLAVFSLGRTELAIGPARN